MEKSIRQKSCKPLLPDSLVGSANRRQWNKKKKRKKNAIPHPLVLIMPPAEGVFYPSQEQAAGFYQ